VVYGPQLPNVEDINLGMTLLNKFKQVDAHHKEQQMFRFSSPLRRPILSGVQGYKLDASNKIYGRKL